TATDSHTLEASCQISLLIAVYVKKHTLEENVTKPSFLKADGGKRVRRTHFCAVYPDSCQIPNDIDKFCLHHPVICEGNYSNIMIPKFGYYTNLSTDIYSLGEKAWKLTLKTSPRWFMTYYRFSSSFETTYVRWVKQPMEETIYDGNDLPYVACHSRNLRTFSQDEPEIQKLYGETTRYIQRIYIPNNEYEAFYPWIMSPTFFSIHSSVIPENPLSMGKRLRLGHQYKVSFRLEEEHLLPLPYETNCTHYDALWRQNNKTGPRSQQMCVYMCLKSSRKLCPGCEGERMMHEDKYKLFPNRKLRWNT
ncbi:uncharacterized protein CDAR_425491, partial [Caerostris darwini]